MIVSVKHKFSLDNKVIAVTGIIGISACSFVYAQEGERVITDKLERNAEIKL